MKDIVIILDRILYSLIKLYDDNKLDARHKLGGEE